MMLTNGRIAEVLFVAMREFNRADHLCFFPDAALADTSRIQPGGHEGCIVTTVMPHGCGVQARILLLQGPAVQRLTILPSLT